MTGFEQRVYDVFSQNDLFVTLDSAMTYFTGMSRTQVENALESLCQQGKLYSTDTFVGKMYGYDSTEYCLADNALDVNISTGEGMESVIEALQNNDAVMIRATDLLADFDEKTDETQNLASVLSKIASKSTETETPATKTGTLFDWTFNNGLRAGERNWDVAIPDGFVKVGSSSRRFELIPADVKYRYSDDRPVEILPTTDISGQDDSGLDLDIWFYHPLSNKARGLQLGALLSRPQKVNLNLSINGGEKRNISSFDTGAIPTKDIFGVASRELVIFVVVQDIMGTNSFLINFYSDEQHKQIRIRTGYISDKDYTLLKNSIIRWADTFRFSKTNKKTPSLLIDSLKCIEELNAGKMTTTLKALDIIARDVAAPGNVISDVGNICLNILGEEKTKKLTREQLKDGIATREFYIPRVEKLFEQIRNKLPAEKMIELHEAYHGLSLTYLEAHFDGTVIREELSPESKKIVDKWTKEIEELERKHLLGGKLTKKELFTDKRTLYVERNIKSYYDMSTVYRVNKLTEDMTRYKENMDHLAGRMRIYQQNLNKLRSEKLDSKIINKVKAIIKNVYTLIDDIYKQAEKAAEIAVKFSSAHRIPCNRDSFALSHEDIKHCAINVSYLITTISVLVHHFSVNDPENELLPDLYNCLLESVKYTRFKFVAKGFEFSEDAIGIVEIFKGMPTPQVMQLMNETKEEKMARLEKKKEEKYINACNELENVATVAALKRASVVFKELGDYKDSTEKYEECNLQIKYLEACKEADQTKTIAAQKKAIQLFTDLGSYKDSESRVAECHQRIQHIKELEIEKEYKNAIGLLSSRYIKENVAKAKDIFFKLGDYKDSKEKYTQARDLIAEITQREMDYGEYKKAISVYKQAQKDRENEIVSLVEKEMLRLKSEAEEKLDAEYKADVRVNDDKKGQLVVQRTEIERTLSSLGIFKGKEKKHCRAEIERLNGEIKQLEEKNHNLRRIYSTNLATILNNIDNQEEEIKNIISQQLPSIEKPTFPEHLKGHYRPL